MCAVSLHSLLLHHRHPVLFLLLSPACRTCCSALQVVCAVSLVGQWQAEAQAKTAANCRIHPYHGQSRIRDPQRLATEFDVVVTTYQTLQVGQYTHLGSGWVWKCGGLQLVS